MGVRINNLVKDFPFVYICDGREECDNFVYLFYDKSAFLVNVLETSERFERVKMYPIYGTNDFDVELDEVLKKLPNEIFNYYNSVIHDRDNKKENQDSKDRRIDCLEEELKEVKDELYKFKCQMKYELSGWEGFCKFINII